MIERIDHTNLDNANKIWDIFQHSYAVEADILKAVNFPPLQRSVSDFLVSETIFFAYYINFDIAGLIEIDINQETIHIQSLVVYPKYFRQGIGKSLVRSVLTSHLSFQFTVETGVDNVPAKRLYSSLGFTELYEWDTDHGIRKVRFINSD